MGAVPCGPIFIALVPGIGTCGSIIATWAYLPKFAPCYMPGNTLNVGATTLAAAIALLIMLYCKRENSLRDAGKWDRCLEGLNSEEIAAWATGIHLLLHSY
ncbi:hypothetical protein BCR35DRAFT_335725 [Leucosporidium creatinivorum]|uniref:Uncharacterized protein n=1 Tax=Leucosporidium creatinivorum TaxID=106004 RepID=A0A1Y2D6I4_9BASI|nr:hypothetical protein BCR35DRAFT_335725 [Leucosporidium creatinivorum]